MKGKGNQRRGESDRRRQNACTDIAGELSTPVATMFQQPHHCACYNAQRCELTVHDGGYATRRSVVVNRAAHVARVGWSSDCVTRDTEGVCLVPCSSLCTPSVHWVTRDIRLEKARTVQETVHVVGAAVKQNVSLSSTSTRSVAMAL